MNGQSGEPAGAATAAPPGDDQPKPAEAGAETVDPVLDAEPLYADFPEVGGVRLRADFENLDEYTQASIAAANAEAQAMAQEGAEGDETPPPATTVQATPAPAAAPVSVDAGGQGTPPPAGAFTPEQIEAAQKAGWKIEAPAPPPDPLVELNEQIEPDVGQKTYDGYVAILAKPLPPKPDEYTMRDEPDSPAVKAYTEAVEEQDRARAALGRMNDLRQYTNKVLPWVRHRVLREHGSDIDALAERHPNIDRAILQAPPSLGAIFEAQERAVTERLNQQHAAEIANLKKQHQGELALARAGAKVDRLNQIGGAPPAASGASGTPATPGRFGDMPMVKDPVTGMDVPSDEWLAAARSGRLAGR